MAVSKRLRFEILRRDRHACRYCGSMAPDVKLTVDHVVPVALGGSDEPSNLVTACTGCNAGKSSISPDTPIVEDVTHTALMWKAALDRAWEDWRFDQEYADQRVNQFDEAWLTWGWGEGEKRQTIPRDPQWRSSVERWLAAGFEVEELVGFIPTAMGKTGLRKGNDDRWPYFCGIVWRTLDKIQQSTAEHIEQGEEWDRVEAEWEAEKEEESFERWLAVVCAPVMDVARFANCAQGYQSSRGVRDLVLVAQGNGLAFGADP